MKRIVYNVEIDTSDATNSTRRIQEALRTLNETTGASQREINTLQQELKDLAGATGELADETENAAQQTQTLQQRYRDLVRQASQLDEASEEFRNVTREAGELKDRIDATRESIRNLSASPIANVTNSFQSLKMAIRELDMGGVVKSFGDLKTSLVGVGSSLLGIEQGMTKATIAAKLFQGALIATGVAAFVVVIGTLISNFDTIKESGGLIGNTFKVIGNIVDGVTISVLKLSDALGLTDNAFELWKKSANNAAMSTFDIKKETEELNKEIRNLRKELGESYTDDDYTNMLDESLEGLNKKVSGLRINISDSKVRMTELKDEAKKTFKEINDLENSILNRRMIDVDAEAGVPLVTGPDIDALRKVYDEIQDEINKRVQKEIALEKDAADVYAKILQLRGLKERKIRQEQSDESLKLELDALNRREKVTLLALTNQLQAEVITKQEFDNIKTQNDIMYMTDRKNILQRYGQEYIDVEIGIANKRIEVLNTTNAQRLAAEQAAFQASENLSSLLLELQGERDKEKESAYNEEIKSIDRLVQLNKVYAVNEQERLEGDIYGARMKKQVIQDNLAQQVAAYDLELQATGMADVQRLAMVQSFELSKKGIMDQANAEIYSAEQALLDFKKKLMDEEVQKATQVAKERKQLQISITTQLLSTAANATSRIMAFERQATEYKIQQAGENFEAAEALRKKGFENQKALGIVNAVVNTAVGITNALATSGPPWVGIAMAAVTGALGAAEIAMIASQQYTPGGGSGGGSGVSNVGNAAAQVPAATQAGPNIQFAGAGAGGNIQTAGGGTPESIQWTGSISVTEINDVQNLVDVYENSSLLGGG